MIKIGEWSNQSYGDFVVWERVLEEERFPFTVAIIKEVCNEYNCEIFLYTTEALKMIRRETPKFLKLEKKIFVERDLDVLKFKADLFLFLEGYSFEFLGKSQ